MISVITVCYNSAATIEKTFESMLKQTYQDFEYIVVDGGSTDGTLQIIEKYQRRFNSKMRYISEQDRGIYDAMNKGIRMCCGELIGIVNSDDFYEANTLELVASHSTGAKYEVVYGMLRTIKEGRECSVAIYHHDFLNERMIPHPTCFITKKAYEDFGVYSMDYKSAADYELMLRFHEHKEVVFSPIYAVLSNFTVGGISSTNVGMLETALLKYRKGLISRGSYFVTWVQVKFGDWIRKTR